jgi:phosphoglycerol transferase
VKKLEIDISKAVLGGLCAALFLFLVIRNTGLYPSVFFDEYSYSRLSRLHPLSDSPLPSYIYLMLYSSTNYCGDGFLGCAKLINSFCFVLAAPFIYSTCRRIADESTSVFVALLAIIGPINSYTAYYMPESLYFLSFWVFCWYLLSLSAESQVWRWCLTGAIFGASALIKPHSFLYSPAVILYIGFLFHWEGRFLSKQTVAALLSFFLGTFVAKFGISLMIAGSNGLTILGSMYGTFAASNAPGRGEYIQRMLVALGSLKGHMLVLALVYGMPIALSVVAAGRALLASEGRPEIYQSPTVQYEKLSFLALFLISNLVCVSVLLTATVAGMGPTETPYRLHMRYYNFALPLLYMIAAGALGAGVDVKWPVRFTLGGVIAVMSAYAVWTNLVPYTLIHVDSPEIFGIHAEYIYFILVGGVLISTQTAWVLAQRKGLQLYLYIALPLFVLVSQYGVGLEQRKSLSQNVYDRAGIFTKQYLTNDDLSKIIVVGSDGGGLYRSLFYTDNDTADFEVIPSNATYNIADIPSDREWLLIIGDHDIIGSPFYEISMGEFTLIRVSSDSVVDFKRKSWPGLVKAVKGLSFPEAWGTWSESDEVSFEFVRSLPDRFEIHLVALAFQPNIDKEIEVSVGDNVARFKLSSDFEKRIIRLENPAGSNVLHFRFPKTASPKDLGLSRDERTLGIALSEMKIVKVR